MRTREHWWVLFKFLKYYNSLSNKSVASDRQLPRNWNDMYYKIKKFIEKYEREHNVRVLDWQQIEPKKLDAWVQTAGFFTETKCIQLQLTF